MVLGSQKTRWANRLLEFRPQDIILQPEYQIAVESDTITFKATAQSRKQDHLGRAPHDKILCAVSVWPKQSVSEGSRRKSLLPSQV